MNEENLKTLISPLITGCSITEIKDFGGFYAVYYQSNEYIESQKFQDLLVGHGPYIVEKNTQKIYETGSVLPVENYIAAIQACGNPYATATSRIKIIGWEIGANKVEATKLIKLKSGMNLQSAKAIIDEALSNKQPIFSIIEIEKAAEIVNELKQFGFRSKQLWGQT